MTDATPATPMGDEETGPKAVAVAKKGGRSWKLGIQITVMLVFSCFLSGVLVSYVPFQQAMVQAGIYHNLCPPNTTETCPAQNQRYQLMYYLAVAGVAASSLSSGVILDVCGVRYTTIGGCILYIGALLLFSLSSQPAFDAFIPGFFFLSFFGYTILLSFLRMAEYVPKHKGWFTAGIINTFDITPIIFFGLERWSAGGSITFSTLLLIYMAFPAALIVLSIFLLPNNGGGIRILRRRPGGLPTASVWNDIFDVKFILMATYVIFVTIGIEYFQGTYPQRFQFLSNNNPQESQTATLVAAISYPAIAIISVPFVGYLFDHTRLTVVFLVSHLFGIAFIILVCFPSIPVQYVGFELQVVFRNFFYSSVSIFVVNIFGYLYFGTLYGLLFFLGGMVSLINIWLTSVVDNSYNGNPLPISSYLTFIAGILIIYNVIFFVWWRRKMDHSRNKKSSIIMEKEGIDDVDQLFSLKEATLPVNTQPGNKIISSVVDDDIFVDARES